MFLPFKKYPYQDYNAFNLDYLINEMKRLELDYKAFVESNIIKYHDPIAWSITEQYEANTIVSNGTDVYLSKQPVPAGVSITNTDYWFKVGDLSTYQLQLDIIRHQITSTDEGNNVNASQSFATGSIFWLNGYLSRATVDIPEGTTFVYGTNYERVTVLELLDEVKSDINTINNTTIPGIQSSIDTINNVTIPAIEDVIDQAIPELRNEIYKNSFRNKACLLVGDSFAAGTGSETSYGWTTYFTQRFGCSPVYTIHQNGGGLAAPGNTNADYPNMNYAQAIAAKAATMTADQKNAVEWVIIQSGTNDVSPSRNPDQVSGVQAGMSALWPVLSSNFPNARIAIIPTYGTTKGSYNNTLTGHAILHYYIPAPAALRGCITSTKCGSWFYGVSQYDAGDNIHLTGAGYTYLAGYIAALCNGWDGVVTFNNNVGVTIAENTVLNLAIMRQGTHVTMRGIVNCSGTYTAGATLFNVSTIYTGAQAIYAPVMIYTTGQRTAAFFQINSNGSVNIRNQGNIPSTGLNTYFDCNFDIDSPAGQMYE